jgi:16S rRNA (cytosine1402-N4)-methyltransferase
VTGTHITVLLNEAVDALQVRPDGHYLDATFGRGGHSRLILSRLGANGSLLALDRDPRAIAAAAATQDSRFRIGHYAFADLDTAATDLGLAGLDGILFDIGVSSPQLDEGERGFSFRQDAPLDMRMDTSRGETAAEWLAHAELREITEVIRNYGEERFAFAIAKKIVAARSEQAIATTAQLAALVRSAVHTREPGQDQATRSFQAIRIHINQELQQLALALPRAQALLKPGGRLVVISFHSLEDRIVKQYFRDQAHPEIDVPKGLPLRHDQLPQPRLKLIGGAIKPSAEEIAANPRARSAVMRIAEKL